MIFQRLSEIRQDREITQNSISKMLGIRQQTYSMWETGVKIIPLKHLNSLCNFYNVSMDYIVGLSNVKNYNLSNKELNKKEIGKKLKEFRKENNITQDELAKLLNTSHSTISAYESGITLILTAFAYEISKHYNISMDWLCNRI